MKKINIWTAVVVLTFASVAVAAPPQSALTGAIALPDWHSFMLHDEQGNYWGNVIRYPGDESLSSVWIDLDENGFVDWEYEHFEDWEKVEPGPWYKLGQFALVFQDYDGDGAPDSWCYWQDTDGDGTHETRVDGGNVYR